MKILVKKKLAKIEIYYLSIHLYASEGHWWVLASIHPCVNPSNFRFTNVIKAFPAHFIS